MMIETKTMTAVLAYLATTPSATADQIAAGTGLRKAAVKGRLASLANAGTVCRAGWMRRERINGGAKDVALWRLTEQVVASPLDTIMQVVARRPPKGARVVRVEDHGHRHGPQRGLDAWRGYGQ